MRQIEEHILTADIGGTHAGLAIFSYHGGNKYELVRHQTFRSRTVRDFPKLLGTFLRRESVRLRPRVRRACIDFAGPIGSDRSSALITNLNRGFTSREIVKATGINEVTLLNDFEAVGYGLEILLQNRPNAFVRLSRSGKLPVKEGISRTTVIIGAGTGLGTAILTRDGSSGRVRPIPGEGGHADFVAVDETEYRIAQWVRNHRNRSSLQPLECEKIVSGPGLVNVYEALSELEPALGTRTVLKRVLRAKPYDRPGIIAGNAGMDALCRKALDVWLRCYARAAKNSAIFPLAPGGVFLAGGVAARILDELQSGTFMQEFVRCDVPNIRKILRRTPVFVVTDYNIGLYGCANVAVNFSGQLAG